MEFAKFHYTIQLANLRSASELDSILEFGLEFEQFCSSWQEFSWHMASRSPSTITEFLVKVTKYSVSFKVNQSSISNAEISKIPNCWQNLDHLLLPQWRSFLDNAFTDGCYKERFSCFRYIVHSVDSGRTDLCFHKLFHVIHVIMLIEQLKVAAK